MRKTWPIVDAGLLAATIVCCTVIDYRTVASHHGVTEVAEAVGRPGSVVDATLLATTIIRRAIIDSSAVVS